MKRSSVLLLLQLLSGVSVGAQTPIRVDLYQGGKLSIDGSTNIIPFHIYQSSDQLFSRPTIRFVATTVEDKIYLSENQLFIQVKSFRSNNPMALHDFLKLIQSDKYPLIKVELCYIDRMVSTDKKGRSGGNALINITITGVTCQYSLPVTSDMVDGRTIISGRKQLNIRDFGLQPPQIMMGLIKVSELITIDFRFPCNIDLDSTVIQNMAVRAE
ncbi:YceI family protein [Paludibacter sp.]|uniref:YceI family protein n=1 Tax=Paludibacter sp. TaxID=1898105 RepID=UPI001356041D|nr:YceI family protein [Paludibacter sp.]MTK51932.1 YceI family protein [Paludibacter sp.]